MPLGPPAGLPMGKKLEEEGLKIVPLGQPDAVKILCVNLMPLKEDTERQLGRNFGQSPVTVDMTYAIPDGAPAKNTDPKHLAAYYKKYSEILASGEKYDGVVVTGAPLEHLPFAKVSYWPEVAAIFDWIVEKRMGAYYLCWGSLAAMYHFYDVPMHWCDQKQFGLYPHDVLEECVMTQGMEEPFAVPVSRHVKHRIEDMHAKLPAHVKVVVDQKETGPCVVWDEQRTSVFMLNHFEYEPYTLKGEYERDLAKGTPDGGTIQIPFNYFPQDDPAQLPLHSWKNNGIQFYNNWIMALHDKKKKPQSKL